MTMTEPSLFERAILVPSFVADMTADGENVQTVCFLSACASMHTGNFMFGQNKQTFQLVTHDAM